MKILCLMNQPEWEYQMYAESGCIDHLHNCQMMGFDYFKSKGYSIEWFFPTAVNSFQRFLCKVFHANPSILGIWNVIKFRNQFDVIYSPLDSHDLILAIFKALRIIRTPVYSICHSSYNLNDVHNNKLKLFLKAERFFTFKYFEKISFASESFLKRALEDFNVPERQRNVVYWGADYEFYYCEKKTPKYYLSIGQAKRDFVTLVSAFAKMPDLNLKILARGETVLEQINLKELPRNDEIISNDNDVEHWNRMKCIYAGAKASLVALNENNHFACGSTVLVESLASGTPFFISDVNNTYVDFLADRIGEVIPLKDVNGWIKVIRHFDQNEDIQKEYSDNAILLSKKKYNYQSFCNKIEDNLLSLL